jgi:hypothetical protein
MNIKAWIQSSNENTDDFMFENGKLIPIEDEKKGREFVNLMFDVKRNGIVRLEEPFLIIQSKKNKDLFLIDIVANNIDDYNRRIPLMLLLEGYEETERSEFKKIVEQTFKKTTPETEVAEETIEKIITTIEKVKKNIERNFLSDPITIGVIIAGILLLILILRELCKD